MLRLICRRIENQKSFFLRNFSSATAPSETTKWDLFVGVQLERLPIISKALNSLEQEYQDLLHQLEFETSQKSDFELQQEKDEEMAALVKSGKIEVDLDAAAKQTTHDLKDQWKEELKRFQPASRTTKADEENDKKSIDRKLDEPLTFIVEQTIGTEKLFLLPQAKVNADETLRGTAERIVKEQCGDSVRTLFYGNAPVGFYKYKYPKGTGNEAIGAKVFFYRAIYKGGNVDNKTAQYEWLDREELLGKVNKHSSYKKSLQKFLI